MNAISIKNLKKTYATGVHALKGVSLEIPSGDFFGLLGQNGAGKTTLIGIISGLVNKTSGNVSVAGFDIDKNPENGRMTIGVVPQEFNLSIFEKVFDIVVDQAGYYGVPRKKAFVSAEKYLRALGLWEKRDQKAIALSGGMKRRLMIARALIHEPQILILDEPTAGVDVELRRGMWDFLTKLNSEGVTIILTTHYLEEAERLAKQLAIIDHGEIIEKGSVKELVKKLDIQPFAFDLEKRITAETLSHLREFDARALDEDTIEVRLPKNRSVNDVFHAFDRGEIRVKNMRTSANRLEELFLNLTKKS